MKDNVGKWQTAGVLQVADADARQQPVHQLLLLVQLAVDFGASAAAELTGSASAVGTK